MAEDTIPTIDLSPFFKEDDEDEGGKSKALQEIGEACSQYGFFQIINHGVPLDLMRRALVLSQEFFSYSDEEKHKSSPGSAAPLPAGYSRQPAHSPDKNEYLLMFPPQSSFNVYPQNPPQFKEVLEEIFPYLVKSGQILEGIVNQCLGLAPNFLREFNHDRSWDFMTVLNYFPASEIGDNGLTEHEDGNIITLIFQDETSGLEVRKDGKWIPVTPPPEKLVVNVGDVIQVMSNDKFKSATHRVVRSMGENRNSYAFFYTLQGDKWVEPLPQFTEEIGEKPKYRGFYYKDYQALRMRNKTHPASKPEDAIHITHSSIS